MRDDDHALRGRRVRVDPVHYPKLAGITFTIVDSARPAGTDSMFVALSDGAGRRLSNWIRDTELLPAPAIPTQRREEMDSMNDLESAPRIQNAASRFEERVNDLTSQGRTAREAFDLAQRQDTVGAQAYRLAGVGSAIARTPAPVISLSAHAGESFDELVMRYAAEKGVQLREAIRIVGTARPDLLEAR